MSKPMAFKLKFRGEYYFVLFLLPFSSEDVLGIEAFLHKLHHSSRALNVTFAVGLPFF